MFAAKNAMPMNRYPAWKYIMIVVLLLLALVYALPNIFGESPAVQVSPKDGGKVSSVLVGKIEKALKTQHIAYRGLRAAPYNVEMRFSNTIAQMQAQEAIQAALGRGYTVAINLAPNTPKWLRALGANPMKLGLDLRGGMYFLLDTDMASVIHNRMQNYTVELRRGLRQADIRYSGIVLEKSGKIELKFRQAAAVNAAKTFIAKNHPTLLIQDNDANSLSFFTVMNPQEEKVAKEYAVQQTVEVMRNRVNELGVSEASVSKDGPNRVVIELPGVQDAARAKAIIGGTATLKVMLVNEKADVQSAVHGSVPIGSSLYYQKNGQPVVLKNRVVLTGKSIVGASVGYDQQTSLPVVNVRLSGSDVDTFSRITGDNVGHLMAIVLVQQTFNKKKVGKKTITVTHTNQSVINVATIQSRLGNNFQITGIGSARSAQNLALMIRAGALPAPVQIVEEKQIGPTMGLQNIKMGSISVLVALILVILFMAFYYRLFGLVADFALVLNLIFIVAVMSIIPGATLTLPGIAGIVLNLGMAIDANVLIFERIREEIRNGNSVQASIHAGYERAFATIVDSNVTTLIVAVILFAVGTGAVKGFAVTLIIGIITSMFTAITVTRAVVNWIYGGRQAKRLSIGI